MKHAEMTELLYYCPSILSAGNNSLFALNRRPCIASTLNE